MASRNRIKKREKEEEEKKEEEEERKRKKKKKESSRTKSPSRPRSQRFHRWSPLLVPLLKRTKNMKERKNSAAAFEQAKQIIPGGVNSPVRALKSVGTTPLFVRDAKGPSFPFF